MRRLSSNSEDRPRLASALSCLKSTSEAGEVQVEDLQPETPQDGEVFSPTVPFPSFPSPSPLQGGGGGHGRSISISVVPCSDSPAEEHADLGGPPTTRVPKSCSAKASHTPPPPSRKLLHLLPNIVLTRSKSQESQLANRIEEPPAHRWVQGQVGGSRVKQVGQGSRR